MENAEINIIKQVSHIYKEDISEYINILQINNSDYIPSGINTINAPFMWEQNITGKNVKIAVIDTGCDMNHEGLKSNIIGGRNFTTEDNGDPDIYQDYNGHGTHVCGTIAGLMNNMGVVGVAPDAKLIILKVLEKSGSGTLVSIIDAINYAIELKVDIISMSLGTKSDIQELHDVIIKAVNSNILVVCATGNEGDGNDITNEFSYPAGYNEVISVGAVDENKSAAMFTNSNKEVDIVAPGVNIISTHINGRYANLSGTSMATPHVSGALALLIEWSTKEFGRRLTETELYGQLIKNSETLMISRTLQGNGLLYLNPKSIS